MPTSTVNYQNNPVLTRIFRGYMPLDMDYVRDKILPVIPVTSQKGDIPSTTTEFIRIHDTTQIGKSGTPEFGVNITKAESWSTQPYALKIKITKQIGQNLNNANWRQGITEAKRMFTKFLKTARNVGRDYALAQVLQSTTSITNNTTLSGSTQWSDEVNSDPINDVETGKTTVFNAIGREPNIAVMNRDVFVALRKHPKVKRTHGVAPDGTVPVRMLNEAEVAVALGLDRIIVGKAFYETARVEGQTGGETSVKASVWGKHFTLMYVNPNPQPDMIEKSLGYTFQMDAPVIDTYQPEDPKNVWYVRMDEEYDDVILDNTAAYLIYNAVA